MDNWTRSTDGCGCMVDAAGVHHPQSGWPQTQAEAVEALAMLLFSLYEGVRQLDMRSNVGRLDPRPGVPVAPLTRDEIRDVLALFAGANL